MSIDSNRLPFLVRILHNLDISIEALHLLSSIIYRNKEDLEDVFSSDYLEAVETNDLYPESFGYSSDPKFDTRKSPDPNYELGTLYQELESHAYISILKWHSRYFVDINYKKILQDLQESEWLLGLSEEELQTYKIEEKHRTLETHREKQKVSVSLKNIPYPIYLQTNHWTVVRILALIRAKFRCQICNNKFKLQTHHRTYENKGREQLDDLIVLCRSCHEKFHDILPKHHTETE